LFQASAMLETGCSEHPNRAGGQMAKNKTLPGKQSVTAFINSIDDEQKRAGVKKVAAMMRKATGAKAIMWGAAIVGYGQYHYKYDNGREGDFMFTGYSPSKTGLDRLYHLRIRTLRIVDEEVGQVQNRQILSLSKAIVGCR